MTQTSIDDIKRKILATPGARNDVQRITKAGADRQALLSGLAIAAMPSQGKSAADGMRRKQRELRSLVGQIRTVAHHIERVALDPHTYLDLWSPFADRAFDQHKERESRRRAPLRLCRAMRRYADWAEDQACKFGRCLRRNAQRERSLGVLWLLSQVYYQTGRLFEAQLARLLIDASEAVGGRRNFTGEQLRKMFRRHVLPNP